MQDAIKPFRNLTCIPTTLTRTVFRIGAATSPKQAGISESHLIAWVGGEAIPKYVRLSPQDLANLSKNLVTSTTPHSWYCYCTTASLHSISYQLPAGKATLYLRPLKYLTECTMASMQRVECVEYCNYVTFLQKQTDIIITTCTTKSFIVSRMGCCSPTGCGASIIDHPLPAVYQLLLWGISSI